LVGALLVTGDGPLSLPTETNVPLRNAFCRLPIVVVKSDQTTHMVGTTTTDYCNQAATPLPANLIADLIREDRECATSRCGAPRCFR
jgi:hypothetical protein